MASRKNLLCYMKDCFLAIVKGQEVPEESEAMKLYAHHLAFNEATSESTFQLCLNCMNMREFGISTDPFTRFIQISSLITSILTISLEFAKVNCLEFDMTLR